MKKLESAADIINCYGMRREHGETKKALERALERLTQR